MIFYLCARTVLDLFVLSQEAFVLVKFSLSLEENPQENFLPIFVSEEAEEAKIWWNQQVQRRTRSFTPDLSNCGSHCSDCFILRRMVKGTRVKDISPANEAESQNTSASRTKLLENERDFETSTERD